MKFPDDEILRHSFLMILNYNSIKKYEPQLINSLKYKTFKN